MTENYLVATLPTFWTKLFYIPLFSFQKSFKK